MSWTTLTLATNWTNNASYNACRAKQMENLTNEAQLEGHIVWGGTTYGSVTVTTLPGSSGLFDTSKPHSIGARCYDSGGAFLGCCEIVIQTSGAVDTSTAMPTGTVGVVFNGVYPTA